MRFLAPFLFGLIGAGILISLGVWQVQRLDVKEAQLLEIETKIAATPVYLPIEPDADAHKYLPVAVDGQFGEGALRVLVSRKRVGAGYLIISPFTTADGRRILIDRGFLKIEDALPTVPSEPVTLRGNLHWPEDRNSSTPDNDVSGNTWFARDLGDMASNLKTEPVLLIVRETSYSDGALVPLPVDTTHIPNDHLQYAVTWFSLAFIWLVMTGYYILRLRRKAEGSTP